MSLLSVPIKSRHIAMLHCIQICTNDYAKPRSGKTLHTVDYVLVSILHWLGQTTNILRICVLVLSLHIIWHNLLFVFQCKQNSYTSLRSVFNVLPALRMSNVLRCLYLFIPMQWSICLFIGTERRNVFENWSALWDNTNRKSPFANVGRKPCLIENLTNIE